MKAIFAGSFCPPTMGHIDLMRRGAKLYDTLVVAVLINPDKKYVFDLDQRLDMLKKSLYGVDNIEIIADSGLQVDVAKRVGADVILRGVRNGGDLNYEMQLAVANKRVSGGLETVFLPAAPELMYLSSTIVMGYAMHGGDITGMVPDEIKDDIYRAFNRQDR